jgi:hypothetical protein
MSSPVWSSKRRQAEEIDEATVEAAREALLQIYDQIPSGWASSPCEIL